MNGRRYFADRARDLKLEGLAPDQISDLAPLDLKRGAAESRLGGRITRDLVRPSRSEVGELGEKSDDLLGKPVRRFPAEDAER